MYLIDDELPYYKTDFFAPRWNYRQGCKPLNLPGISFDKPPPPLPPPPKDKTARAKQDVIKVPPFDIQEIPDAMRLEQMPIAAKLMERWFAGVLNYAPTDADLKAEKNQRGEPYPPSMYDTTSIKMDWVLRYKRAEVIYLDLLKSRIYRPAALDRLRERLLPFKNSATQFDSWALCRNSMSMLHRHFHLQFAGVGSSLSQKIGEFMDSQFRNNGVPDDLTGALGSFNFYVAPADVRIGVSGSEAVVSSVYVYVKDSYDFTDKPGDVSQYLGHWSRKGVIVVPYNGLVGQLNVPTLYLPYPVARGNMRGKGNVYYPVHNKDFRQWAMKHQRGGDFIIFSNRKCVRLREPIRVKL
ncbi:DUF6402 family protein [Paraburkholderia silviterrae]|uniref:Uncharacterized protein n=1 Tax=Paraburkholderia silviterrae TaxID=2528715 RepID=A0A4R5MC77_9BURK|nr:DUF6402 family protein [Paraburkholderia silviterrae]TDG24550.1 hypothetical protein EYW47_08315 [Paraburkholderia silviterrae]